MLQINFLCGFPHTFGHVLYLWCKNTVERTNKSLDTGVVKMIL